MNAESTDQLAIHGGPKVSPEGVTPRKLFGEEERREVMNLFDRAIAEGSHLLGYGGEQEELYCEAFCETLGGGYADGVNSGTNAVYAALGATDPPPMAEVVVPPISDPGGVMPVTMLNCIPVAADADSDAAYNTGAGEIEKVLSDKTHAIIVAHIAGIPVDMGPVLRLAEDHDLYVVEDCAQAHGARYRGRPVGTLGHVAAFSTMFGKHHASGGQGGIVFTRDEKLYYSARRMADRGKPFGLDGACTNVRASLNANMDELHAAIGRTNLTKLNDFVTRRREIAERVGEALSERSESCRLVRENEGDTASYWFLIVRIETDALRVSKTDFVAALREEGLPAEAGYGFFPLRMQWATERCTACGATEPCDRRLCPMKRRPVPELPKARAANQRHFRVSLHEGWTGEDVDNLIRALLKVESAYLG